MRTSRRQFLGSGSAGIISSLLLSSPVFSKESSDSDGWVVNDDDGEAFRIRDGTAIVRIKICKRQGVRTISFLSGAFKPGDALPAHKHLNEDELIFLHRGSGVFTLGEKQYAINEGAVALVPRGVWHGLENTGTKNIEMRFAYIPPGFEGFFREVGTAIGRPFVQKSMDQRRAIAKKWGMIYKH
jgi:quercetin dioxygenase-like cupin family protein